MSAETKANLQDATKKVADLSKECTANQPRVTDVLKNLKAGIDKKDGVMLELYLKRVDGTSKLVADTLRDSTNALAAIKLLEDDADFMEAKFDDVKALTEKVDKTKTNLSSQLLELKQLQKDALKILDELSGGTTEAVAKYAELEDRVNDRKDAMEKKRKELEAQVPIADKAFAAKDQKKLTDARLKIIDMDFGRDKVELGKLDRDIDDFMKKYKDAGLNTDAQWLKDEVYKMKDIAEDGDKQMQRLVKLGQVPKPEPAEIKPAKLSNSQIAQIAKFFPLNVKDSKQMAQYSKVVNTFPHNKWPDEFMKTFDWKKAEVEAGMKKANLYPFVQSLYLIDI
jgi:DNA repair exonuclease SbcCD ATPase subunit